LWHQCGHLYSCPILSSFFLSQICSQQKMWARRVCLILILGMFPTVFCETWDCTWTDPKSGVFYDFSTANSNPHSQDGLWETWDSDKTHLYSYQLCDDAAKLSTGANCGRGTQVCQTAEDVDPFYYYSCGVGPPTYSSILGGVRMETSHGTSLGCPNGTRSTRLNLKCPTAKYPDRTSIFLSENPTCTYNINFYIKEACGTNPNCSTFTFSYELGHDPRSLFVTPQKASSVSMPYCGIVSSSGEVEGWVTLYNGSDCMTTGSEFSQYQNVWTGVGTSGGKVYDAKGYKSACAFSWECYGSGKCQGSITVVSCPDTTLLEGCQSFGSDGVPHQMSCGTHTSSNSMHIGGC